MTLSIRSLALISVSGLAALAPAQHKPEKPAAKPAAHDTQEKKETFAVISVGHHLDALAATAVKALEKKNHQAFEKAKADYDKEKAAAEAAKKPFDKKAPEEESVEVKKDGFATMAEAQKYLAELKKAEKPATPPTPAPKK